MWEGVLVMTVMKVMPARGWLHRWRGAGGDMSLPSCECTTSPDTGGSMAFLSPRERRPSSVAKGQQATKGPLG
jgi:hypothetical protein